MTGFAYSGDYNIVPAVADKSVETAFFVQDDWKVTPKLTVNLGLRYEWSNPYTERFNRSQFSDFTGDTGINIPGLGEIMGTTIFATSSRRSAAGRQKQLGTTPGFRLSTHAQHGTSRRRWPVLRNERGHQLPICGYSIPKVLPRSSSRPTTTRLKMPTLKMYFQTGFPGHKELSTASLHSGA